MTHPLIGASLKMWRAAFHVEMLNAAIERFREPGTYELTSEDDPQTDERVWYAEIKRDAPNTWAPVIGDLLHNLHSALDHVAWQLAVERNYGHDLPPGTRATFPIFKNRGRFWKRDRKGTGWSAQSGAAALRRFAGDARRLVIEVQPYKDGNRAENHGLWLLHILSNEDKHKTLHVVRSAMVDSDLEVVELVNMRIDHFTPIGGPLRLGRRTEIGRAKVTAIDPAADAYCHLKPKFAIGEAFAEGTPLVAGRYVGEVFDLILNAVRIEVFHERFGPYFGISDWLGTMREIMGDALEYPM